MTEPLIYPKDRSVVCFYFPLRFISPFPANKLNLDKDLQPETSCQENLLSVYMKTTFSTLNMVGTQNNHSLII